ncbi:hypothetical protein HanRHA438_Chr12g0574441 [Helianthus annuus]|nr:hypothetical protein HanIR_Chr12g0608051 [Helianthus annuus]KAJ0868424.1 hypothetical protein HanRHA438_Chr12g0574441 [Helianthus annuus]
MHLIMFSICYLFSISFGIQVIKVFVWVPSFGFVSVDTDPFCFCIPALLLLLISLLLGNFLAQP